LAFGIAWKIKTQEKFETIDVGDHTHLHRRAFGSKQKPNRTCLHNNMGISDSLYCCSSLLTEVP